MRFFSNRQDDTTNSQVPNTRIETGWGVIPYNTASAFSFETVTFQTAFTNKPIVIISFGGDHATLTTYGSGGNNVEGDVIAKAGAITTTTFEARLCKPAGGNFLAGNGFYEWIAIGV